MEDTKSKVERQCSRNKHISTFTAKSDGSFYKTCDNCRAYNRAKYHNKISREAEQRDYRLRLNVRRNFENVLNELGGFENNLYRLYGKRCTEKHHTAGLDIDYNDRCDGCEKHNDFCRCGPDFF